ncbi:hypothetical protein ABW20_dc0105893 [Dactylellina cionopaga]|nr:hypothetical protein ABW20_dc0105893 [Dactylellina cionopaga]
MPHASVHLPKDDICFIFLTSDDFATYELEAQAFQEVTLCESLAKFRGIIFLDIKKDVSVFDRLQDTLRRRFDESETRPFLLPLPKAEDLTATVESFLRDFRAQKVAQVERNQKLQNARTLRSLNLLGKAITHTDINEHGI